MAEPADDQEPPMEGEPPPAREDEAPGHQVVIIIAVFFEAGLAPFSLIIGWLMGHPPLEHFVWSLKDALWGVTAALPLIVLFLAMLRWPVGPLAAVKDLCEQEVVPLFRDSNWSELALISLSAGVGEEMLFRGVIQASLTDWRSAGASRWPASSSGCSTPSPSPTSSSPGSPGSIWARSGSTMATC
jgi:uncharacterized protein